MARIALLIGVSEYQPGLNKLAGAVKDVEAMQRVLQHPEMGGFAESEIIVMPNPQRQDMENAIEKLFANRKKDDLLLFYFSGHGITDDTGKLYLTNSQTCKYDNGNLVKTTATPASLIHEFMENSRSQRQVIILDACYSGAFAEGMKAKDDSSVDINQQLGGKGRAVLTSSSSSQYSFEQTAEDLSVYTRYIVNGIETGAADTDNDGMISVDELHEFARKKVQEAAPAMNPKIYAVEEGFKIKVAKAPIGDPKLKYRKEVEKYLRDGKLSPIGNRILNRYQNELGLSDDEVKQIQNEVLEPYRIYQANLKEYEEALQEALQHEGSLSQFTQNELKHFQQLLQLRDEDVEPINKKLISFSSLIDEEVKESENKSSPEKQTFSILENTTIPSSEDDISSEKEIDYTKLRDLLKAGNWKDADYETDLVMLKAVGREKGDGIWIKDEELLNFPCTDLRTIDKLWVKYSNCQFGFSVQKEIYLRVGGILDGKSQDEAWDKFSEKVGWRIGGEQKEIIYTKDAPPGHLPYVYAAPVTSWAYIFESFVGFDPRPKWLIFRAPNYLFRRIETCKV
ncbi:GUN4 domain-containing protein [Dolichospermum sp. UHCC 0259]|uniref:caspase, EACC1-associated type n=1 Tax=Dolichospermum sp. UHCC 0259 TaxID=2590010 RepID=UPI001447EB1D|nr:GUN4 domain-containing protein [Dolichospermum sp. UHCC 0259]MTJ47207.1 Clp protease [Dolichospermum sp. UHCC 0259]